jgi:adenine-specific DNA-methyltransferase
MPLVLPQARARSGVGQTLRDLSEHPWAGAEVTLTLTDFVIPPDDVPEEVSRAIKHWSQWIDYWAIDWNNKNDTFHNEWQEYRTREKPKLTTESSKTYDEQGEYRVVVKVVDILGNDTTKMLQVKV